jgi:predicted nucleic acid-binding protein
MKGADENPQFHGLRVTDAAKPVLDDLIQVARFWIGGDLYREVLERLNES